MVGTVKQGILSKNAHRLLMVAFPQPLSNQGKFCGYGECFRVLHLGLRTVKKKRPYTYHASLALKGIGCFVK